MKALPAIILLIGLAHAACNKHSVPIGGECAVNEDCDQTSIACLKPAGASTGFCTKPCSIAPPGTKIQSDAPCEQAGLACVKHASPHTILGEAYCDRP